jgi:hypothetical protein
MDSDCISDSPKCGKCDQGHYTHRCPIAIEASQRKRKSYADALMGPDLPTSANAQVSKLNLKSSDSGSSYMPPVPNQHISSLNEIIHLQSRQIAELQAQVKELLNILASSTNGRPRPCNTPSEIIDSTEIRPQIVKNHKKGSRYASVIEDLQARNPKMELIDSSDTVNGIPCESKTSCTALATLSTVDCEEGTYDSEDDAMSTLHV